jgi:hypothetical protein
MRVFRDCWFEPTANPLPLAERKGPPDATTRYPRKGMSPLLFHSREMIAGIDVVDFAGDARRRVGGHEIDGLFPEGCCQNGIKVAQLPFTNPRRKPAETPDVSPHATDGKGAKAGYGSKPSVRRLHHAGREVRDLKRGPVWQLARHDIGVFRLCRLSDISVKNGALAALANQMAGYMVEASCQSEGR